MTRVILSPSVLEYRQAMAELVHEVCQKNTIIGVDPPSRSNEQFPARRDFPALYLAGLLTPPRIEVLDPCLFIKDGQLDGIIQVTATGVYGVMNVYIILEDDQGKHIESGFAMSAEEWEDYWGYIPSAPLRSGTSVTVRAIAMDPLGGTGVRHQRITVAADEE